MKYKFQHIQIPSDVHFDDDHLAFLETLDKGLVDLKQGNDDKIKDLVLQLEETKMVDPDTRERKFSQKERKLNNDWIRNFLNKKDKVQNIKDLAGKGKNMMLTSQEIEIIEQRNLNLKAPIIIYDKETDEVQKILRSIAEKAGLDIINLVKGK